MRIDKRNEVLQALKRARLLLDGADGCYARDDIEVAKEAAKDVLRTLDARTELLTPAAEGEGEGADRGAGEESEGEGETDDEHEPLSTRRDDRLRDQRDAVYNLGRMAPEGEEESDSEAVLSDSEAGQSEQGEPDTDAAVTRQQSQAEAEQEEPEQGEPAPRAQEPESAAATRSHFLAGGIGPALVQSVHTFLDNTVLEPAESTPSGITKRDVIAMLREEHNAVRDVHYTRAWLRRIVDSYQEDAIAAAFAPLQEPGALHDYADDLWELAVAIATSPPPGYLSYDAKCHRVAINFLSTISGVFT